MLDAERDGFNKWWKKAKTSADRRSGLCEAAAKYPAGGKSWDSWPGAGLLEKLKNKQAVLQEIEPDASAVPEIIDRFLAIFSTDTERRGRLRVGLVNALVGEVKGGLDDWLELARAALVGEVDKKGKKKKPVGGNLYFDVARGEFARDVHDPRNRAAATRTLLDSDTAPRDRQTERDGRRQARALSVSDQAENICCAITGEKVQLHSGNFPKPNLPIGQGFVFSKNQDLPAAGSYGRFGHDAFPVGKVVVGELAGALTEIVRESRKNVTWCTVPAERRKTVDLLIAFVEGAPDAPAVSLFADDGDDEFDDGSGELDPVAIYERRTERLIEAIEGEAFEDFRKTPVQVCLLRKVDEGNRKAVLHRRLTVGLLYDSAREWAQAQRNLPNWLFLWHKKERRRPRTLTPLSVPSLTRRQFARGGTEATDAIGVPATEAFSLFLREGDTRRLAQRLLHIALRRHHQLPEATAHAKHGARVSRLDTGIALRVLTLLAILLNALGRRGGSWMNDAAFRLGQLLSVADVVHAGYCADVRQGQVPAALLGNAVFTMAQANPAKAVAELGRRWKPYASWAKRASAAEAAKLRGSEKPGEKERGWKISQAIWQYRRAAEISAELHGQLPQTADDVFRAELLLGYVAGLPPRAKAESDEIDQTGDESDA
jgi:hypothetical protein